MPTLNTVATLPRTPTPPAVATLPATATLPAVATLPATATLPTVSTLPVTATVCPVSAPSTVGLDRAPSLKVASPLRRPFGGRKDAMRARGDGFSRT
ncbi:MAG: hypothetical protein ACRDR6_02500 [Pseudonocardiaceae bacterium]